MDTLLSRRFAEATECNRGTFPIDVTRLIIGVFTALALWGTYLLGRAHSWALDVTISLAVAEVAAAASLAALVPSMRQKKASFIVSDAFITFNGEHLYDGYRLQLHLMNVGDRADVLRDVEGRFYKIGVGFINSILTCGGRVITERQGTVLPVKCSPRVQYVVEGIGNIGVAGALMDRGGSEVRPSDYILRCKLIFADARPVVFRTWFSGLYKEPMIPTLLREHWLSLRTRNRDPLEDGSVVWK